MNRIDRAVLNAEPVRALRAAADLIECTHPHIETRNKRDVTVAQCMACGESLWPMDEFDPSAEPFDWSLLRHAQKKRDAYLETVRHRIGWTDQTLSHLYRNAYADYLQSAEWRRVRSAVMRRANGVCEVCNAAPASEVHHLTYDRIGNESLTDLVAICRGCHQEAHQ